jgi:hypothetical protein
MSFAKSKGSYGDEPHGLSFVGCSRTRTLDDILINHEQFDLARLLKIKLPKHFEEFDKRTLELANQTKIRLGL